MCEVCQAEGKTHYDHCHSTGQFRGWLCNSCNCALGFAKDVPATLRALAEYLERGGNHVGEAGIPAYRRGAKKMPPNP